MGQKTVVGLERLMSEVKWQKKIEGRVALLCHNGSINSHFEMAPLLLKKLLGRRLVSLFGPQHGLFTDLQDNMVETDDFIHPYFKLKVYSLYSKTRIPTFEMLKDVDTLILDLQDVGTRIYTYISTMALLMKAIHDYGNKQRLIILDRPNPAGGELIEGNILDEKFKSFVGIHPLPTRHAMTIGELALLFKEEFKLDQLDLVVVPMKNWQRNFLWEESQFPWVMPSPNLSHPISALTFPATVAFEGTNLSEGRGTTRALEIIGHPKLDPYSFIPQIEKKFRSFQLDPATFKLRPLAFVPTFQKHSGRPCGGIQIHPIKGKKFYSWRLGQLLIQELYHHLKGEFVWKLPPYEYEEEKLPIDIINGTDKVRQWIEKKGSFAELRSIEAENLKEFKMIRKEFLLY